MILFYSEYCLHCRMLLETVKRHDTNGIVKLACIENIKLSRNKLPAQITHVPALMTFPEKNLLFGKQVFDYLLLPNHGKLMTQQPVDKNNTSTENMQENPEEPMAYSLGGNSGSYSDSFSMIENFKFDEQDRLSDRSYNWTMINEEISPLKPPDNDTKMQEETRTKKVLDLDAYRIERDMQLKQVDINTNQMPSAEMTR